MGLFGNTKFESLDDLLLHQLQDLYDAEKRLTKAIPKMVEAAQDPQLKAAFNSHLSETETQVKRLEQIFEELGQESDRETCPAMKGLIKEAEEMIDLDGDPDVRDAALIASGQRIEHYEMAGYGSARNFAQRLGLANIAQLLQETLNEEGEADHKLSAIAESSINAQATT